MEKNIITRVPKVGDILFLDENNKKGFIALDTFDAATFDGRYTLVGVVALRQGNTVTVVHKNNASKKWCEIFQWKVTGWLLDGEAHTTTIGFYSSQQAPANPEFTYTASTMEEVAAQLNAWFDTYFTESNLRYHAVVCDEATLYVQNETYNSWYHYILNMSGLTVNYSVGTKLESNSNTYAYNGIGSVYKGINWARYYQVIHDATSSTFNPTTPITSLGTYPISYACYSGEIGAYARNIYGEGEEGYKKYLQDYMIDFPAQRGILAPEFRNGHKNTYTLYSDKYLAYDGTEKTMYPAFEYCAETEYQSDGLGKGDWYLPSMYEVIKVWRTLTYGTGPSRENSDPINRSLHAIGGDALSCASFFWSSCRYDVGYAWSFGSSGFSGGSNFFVRYYAAPFVLLKMSECELL